MSVTTPFLWVLSIGIVCILLLILNNHHILQSFKIKTITYLDVSSIYGASTAFLLSLYSCIFNGIEDYKTIISLVFLAISLYIFLLRFRSFYKITNQNNNSKNNLFELHDIYNNNFEVESGQPILISEKDTEIDLLNRTQFTNLLYKYITTYNSDSSYVIGLIGEWGSGKTTALNILKKKLSDDTDVICIDDIDLWALGSQEAVLIEIYEKLLQNSGIRYSSSQNKRIMDSFKSIISEYSSNKSGLSNLIDIFDSIISNDTNELDNLIENIKYHINIHNKKILFIIDNIDRANSDNIVFLFKLIGTIFNLPNVVYILSYDKQQMDRLLQDNAQIDPRYIEKIVQQEMYVPNIDTDTLNDVYGICIANILEKYGVTSDQVHSYHQLFQFIRNSISDLRTFKRLINSVFSSVFLSSCRLDIRTLLSLETIHFVAPELYESILDNPKYFISEDVILDSDLYSFRYYDNNANVKIKEYFDKLNEDCALCMPLLSTLFPNVYRYIKGYNIIEKYGYDIPDYIKTNIPIYSLKYFDLYFSFSNNMFSSIVNEIEDLIYKLNSLSNQTYLSQLVKETLIVDDSNVQKELLEKLYLYSDEIPSEASKIVINVLWENIDKIDSTHEFMALNAHQRAYIIIAKLLKQLNIDEIKSLTTQMNGQYSNLLDISNLINWLESKSMGTNEAVISLFKGLLSELCSKIVNENINLYEDSIYRRRNILGFTQYYRENEEIIKTYMTNIYDDKYVYRILADFISEGVGTGGYSYEFNSDNIKATHIEEDVIAESIERNPPSNETEEMIKTIFEKYKNGELNIFDRTGINLATPISFNL